MKSKIKNLLSLTQSLITQTRCERRWNGSPKNRLHQVITTYHQTNNCTQCKTDPEHSFSHTIDRILMSSGVVPALIAISIGVFGHLFIGGDWRDGNQMGVKNNSWGSGRDDFGWRSGGITNFMFIMDRFERGGW